MIDHITFGVTDFARSTAFYDQAFAPLGVRRLFDVPYEQSGGVKLSVVMNGGSAHAAGLSAGDVVVAIDGLKVAKSSVEKSLAVYRPGDNVVVHAFRRDELMTFDVELQAPEMDTIYLTIDDADKVKNFLRNIIGRLF